MLQGLCASFEASLREAPQDEGKLSSAIHQPLHPEVLSPERKPRRTHSALAALLALLLTPTAAHACSSIRIAPEGFRQQAAAIIEGRVMGVKREGGVNGRLIARIAVTKRVKGQTPRSVTVATRGNTAACGVNFTKGQTGEFLLARTDGRYTTNLCLMLGARR